jgi:hypothetical protein
VIVHWQCAVSSCEFRVSNTVHHVEVIEIVTAAHYLDKCSSGRLSRVEKSLRKNFEWRRIYYRADRDDWHRYSHGSDSRRFGSLDNLALGLRNVPGSAIKAMETRALQINGEYRTDSQ